MIIVDEALRRREEEGTPIKVGVVGAGAMGRAITYQIASTVPGMEVAAIANRTVEHAEDAHREAGVGHIARVQDEAELAAALERGTPAVTTDPTLLASAEGIDAILEVTGAVEFGARVALAAIAGGKHLITMNAELQGTLGPLLHRRAAAAGVVLSDCDGDQPGVMMNLYRFVRSIGLTPILVGNIKGLHDPYRNPATQEAFARRHGLSAHMAASFADGTKLSFEMTLVANATGFRAGRRGLYGPSCDSVHDARELFPLDQMAEIGLVDYIVGAQPAPGVFVLADIDDDKQRRFLELYKMGDEPPYTFFTPYHLCHLEAPLTVARVVLFHDTAVAPEAGHVVDVVATAKRDLTAGEVLDGIGGFMTYGQCENAEVVREQELLPMGLAEGCRLVRDISANGCLTYDDVELPDDRLVDRLREEQLEWFPAGAGHPVSDRGGATVTREDVEAA